MSPDKKRDKSIKDVPVTKLLDDFTEPNPVIEDQSRTEMTDEEYVEMMVKKEIERKLMRTRRYTPVEIPEEEVYESEAIPEIPEGSCPSCHYCTIIKRIGDAVYCVCANPEREVEGMYFDHRMWVRSELDLVCHKEPPSMTFQKQLRQHIENQLQHQLTNEPEVSEVKEKVKPIIIESEVMNFFDKNMELVEEEPDIEDPAISHVEIRPPDFRRRSVEPVTTPEKNLQQLESSDISKLRNEAVDDYFREETIAVHKHKALATLKRYRREKPVAIRRAEEGPIVSEKLAPMRNCESCYFCVDNKRVGGSSWCHCTNLARSTETTTAASWVRSKLNAPCWKREDTFIH